MLRNILSNTRPSIRRDLPTCSSPSEAASVKQQKVIRHFGSTQRCATTCQDSAAGFRLTHTRGNKSEARWSLAFNGYVHNLGYKRTSKSRRLWSSDGLRKARATRCCGSLLLLGVREASAPLGPKPFPRARGPCHYAPPNLEVARSVEHVSSGYTDWMAS